MHIDISLAIYIHHSVTCQYIKLYWPLVATDSKLQMEDDEWGFVQDLESTTNMSLPVAHEDDEAHWSIKFSAVDLCIKLVFGDYASCKVIFVSLDHAS